MVPAKMPELRADKDITYLADQFGQNDPSGRDQFQKELMRSLRTISRQLDNLCHNVKHG